MFSLPSSAIPAARQPAISDSPSPANIPPPNWTPCSKGHRPNDLPECPCPSVSVLFAPYSSHKSHASHLPSIGSLDEQESPDSVLGSVSIAFDMGVIGQSELMVNPGVSAVTNTAFPPGCHHIERPLTFNT